MDAALTLQYRNDSQDPVFWLDGLDIPLVQFLGASFAEGLGEDSQPITKPDDDSLARFGANMLRLAMRKWQLHRRFSITPMSAPARH